MTATDTATRPEVKVGDFFYSSWGYDQTNVDFYRVVKVTKTGVRLVSVPSVVVSSTTGSDSVAPDLTFEPDPDTKGFFKKLQWAGDRWAVNLNSYSAAWQWDLTPKHRTAHGFGH